VYGASPSLPQSVPSFAMGILLENNAAGCGGRAFDRSTALTVALTDVER
jgi:hypothetical protein